MRSFPLFTIASPASACIPILPSASSAITIPPVSSDIHNFFQARIFSTFLLLGICSKSSGQLPRERRAVRTETGWALSRRRRSVYLHRTKLQIRGRQVNCGSAQTRISACLQISTARKFCKSAHVSQQMSSYQLSSDVVQMSSRQHCRSATGSSFADHATSLESISCGTNNAHTWPAHSNSTNFQRKLLSTSETITAWYVCLPVSLMQSLLLTGLTVLPT